MVHVLLKPSLENFEHYFTSSKAPEGGLAGLAGLLSRCPGVQLCPGGYPVCVPGTSSQLALLNSPKLQFPLGVLPFLGDLPATSCFSNRLVQPKEQGHRGRVSGGQPGRALSSREHDLGTWLPPAAGGWGWAGEAAPCLLAHV